MKKLAMVILSITLGTGTCFSQRNFNSIIAKVKEMEIPFNTKIYNGDALDLKNEVGLSANESLKFILNSSKKTDLKYTNRVFDPDQNKYIGKVTRNYNYSLYRKLQLNSFFLIIYGVATDDYQGYYVSVHDTKGVLRDKLFIYDLINPGIDMFDINIKSKISKDFKVKTFEYYDIKLKDAKNEKSKYFNKNCRVVIKTYSINEKKLKFNLIKQDTVLSISRRYDFFNSDEKEAAKIDPFNQ